MQKIESNSRPIILRKQVVSSSWQNDEFRVYWEGLVFINGILSGVESVKKLVHEIARRGIKDACRLLKGIFFIFIEQKATGDCYAFVDNSGLYQAFYTQDIISTSFLEIIREEKCHYSDLDPDAVVEFLYFGCLYFNKTFFKSICRIPQDKILHYSSGSNKIDIFEKNIPPIYESSENLIESFHEIFSNMALSLSNLKISIDFTGGTDSRLLALILDSYGLKFETAVSGGTLNYQDVIMSEKVATAVKYPWYSAIHSITSLQEDIPELFYATEGLFNLLDYHAFFQLQRDRSERGIDTIISGVGGEIFKDFWWLQDFPFYSRRSSNIERLVDTRIMSFRPCHSIFTEKYYAISQGLRDKIIKYLRQYLLDSNTRTYDNICFHFRMREEAGRELTNYSPYVKSFAPLLDLDIVRIGFNLPRRKRFLNMFHRRELTKINPLIAKMPTTEGGISASSELTMILLDLPKYIIEKANRLLIKLNWSKRTNLSELIHPDFYHNARGMKVTEDSLKILKEIEIINHKTDLEQIEDRSLGSLLSLGMLINYVNEKCY